MRINQTFSKLNDKLSTAIRRQYPFAYTPSLNFSFDQLTKGQSLENNLARTPFIEALPQYVSLEKGDYSRGLEALKDAKYLGEEYHSFVDFMLENGKKAGFFDPYAHQMEAIRAWARGADVVVSTGTGSGKTECFLWPIAAHLHKYAERNKDNPGEHRGLKAIVLYPMNALVADQLKRLRGLFGSKDVADALSQGTLVQGEQERPFQFGQYTGRTKFHGSYAKAGRTGSISSKVKKASEQFGMYSNIETHDLTRPQNGPMALYSQLKGLGLIPAKGDDEDADGRMYWSMQDFEQPTIGDRLNVKLITKPGDRELVFRHEMHNTGYSNVRENDGETRRITGLNNGGGTPDILVTNYSMLEYMLKRPLEHGIFHETKGWLTEHDDNKLLFVLDEAHLYQGALGTEVGLLVRRLLSSLGVLGSEYENKVQFILTSASLGADPESKEKFVHGLTGRPPSDGGWTYKDVDDIDWETTPVVNKHTVFVGGKKWMPNDPGETGLDEIQNELIAKDYNNVAEDILVNFFMDKYKLSDKTELAIKFRETPLFFKLYAALFEEAISIDDLAIRVIGNKGSQSTRRNCIESILNMVANLTCPRPNSTRTLPLLGVRAHLLYRGLPRVYWALDEQQLLLREPSSSTVAYPIRGCRKCGAPYLSIWVARADFDDLVTQIEHTGPELEITSFSRPINNSVRMEVYLYSDYEDNRGHLELGNRTLTAPGPAHVWVNVEQHLIKYNQNRPGDEWLPGYLPSPLAEVDHRSIIELQTDESTKDQFSIQELTYSKSICRQCHTDHSNRRTSQITDYMTRGDDAFSVIMKELIDHQPDVEGKEDLPNRGKKVMVFSDSRARAAKLAKNIQDNSNYDELRRFVIHTIHQPWYQALDPSLQSIHHLYSLFILNCVKAKLEPFASTGDDYRNARASFAMSRMEILAAHAAAFHEEEKVRDAISQELVIELMNEAVEEDLATAPKSDSFFDDFHRTAPAQNTEIFQPTQPRANRWHTKSHRGFIRKIRKDFARRITTGIKKSDDSSLTNTEKNRLVGFVLIDDFYEGTAITDDTFEQMKNRLSEINLSFNGDPGEEMKWHPLYRARAIISGETDLGDLRKKNEPNDTFERKMIDLREAINSRLEPLHLDRTTGRSKRYYSCKSYLLSNPKSLTELSEYAGQLIQELSRNDLFPKPKHLKNHWSHVHNLANLSIKTPWEFSSSILDFIGSKDFSLNALGLGYISITEDTKQKLLFSMVGEDLEEAIERSDDFDKYWNDGLPAVLSELVNWMSRTAYPSDSSEGKETKGGQRCIKSLQGGYTFAVMKSHRSVYETTEAEWGIPAESCEEKYIQLHQDILSREPELDFLHVRECVLVQNGNADDTKDRLLVNAEKASISLLEDEARVKGCPRCATMVPVIHPNTVPTRCPNCLFDELIDYDPENTIFEQRIEEPWRSEMRKVLVPTGDQAPTLVLRAEEHTAQINTSRDDSEMYTAAEEFELLFQDIPFAVPKEDEIWSTAQAPIDVLSCTTTMEVGIDIGSLTCVALRTVPRKSSNYQQRVGRAGRGTAEVCVAVSWCDNQPHAQNYFDNPQTMLKHPSNSPVIYLGNKIIIQRHVNAAILQAFFKRMNYVLEDRRFDGMTESGLEANLMESMGTMSTFFDETDEASPFNLLSFQNWLGGIEHEDEDDEMKWENVEPQIASLIPPGYGIQLNNLVGELTKFLEEQQAQWNTMLAVGGETNE